MSKTIMFKKCVLVGAHLSPFKKLSVKQFNRMQKLRKGSARGKARNRFTANLRNKRILRLFYKAKPSMLELIKQNPIAELEKKIDVALFRVNFYSSVRAARQAILHKKVLLNNQPILSPNYVLKPGDIFSVDLEGRLLKKFPVKNPSFEVNYATGSAIYLYSAQFAVGPFPSEII